MTYVKAVNQYEKNPDGSYHITSGIAGKIAGTFLGPIMGLSPWNTPFSTACKILRIYDEDIGDKPSVKAGKILESPILSYLDQSGRLPNTQAEKLFPGFETGSHIDWKSHFEDAIFSGHVDGIAGHVTDARAGQGIVECKTTTDMSKWDFINNIPPAHYWLQASLYAYFFGYDTIYFTVGELTQDVLDNPYRFVPNEDSVKIMKVGLYPDFENVLNKAREWYGRYIDNGCTPTPDYRNPIDARICAILDAQKCTVDAIMPKFNDFLRLNYEISEREKERDELKEELMAYLEGHELEGIGNGESAYRITQYARKSVDTDLMKKDGIYDSYIKTSITKSFRKGKY